MYFVFKRSDGYVNAINARDREHAEERLAANRRWTFEILAEAETWVDAERAISAANAPVEEAASGTKQGAFNALAKLLWPQHTGNIWPGDVTMKLMEIGHEWGNKAIERAGDLASEAEGLPEGEEVNAKLAEALTLAFSALRG